MTRAHRAPRASILGVVVLGTATVACGGRATDPVASAELFAVNGARVAPVFPEDTVTWAGFGFGADQGDGAVLVTVGADLQPASVVSWSDAEIRAVVPADVESGLTYVRSASDSLGALELLVRTRTSFDPAAHAWTTDAALPTAVDAPGAGVLRFASGGSISGLVVLNGGRLADGRLNADTYIGVVSADGRVNEWRAAPDSVVPRGRRLHTIVGADRTNSVVSELESVAYMVGGIDSAGRVLAEVVGLGVSAAGEYSLWTQLAPLPDRRAGAATVVAFNRLYVFGGFGSDSLAARGVAYATIRPAGTLTGWFRGPSLPEGRAFAAAVAAGSTLLVLGGERGTAGIVDPDSVTDTTSVTASIFAIRVSPLSGAFRDTAWTELPVTLLAARSRFAAFVVDDALVVTGGVYAGMPSTLETEYAFLADGLPGSFQEAPGALLADLAGGPLVSSAAPVIWTAAGIARVTLIGGGVAGATPTQQVFSY